MVQNTLCKECSKEFIKKRKTNVFCCRSCQAKWLSRNGISGRDKLGIYKKCLACEKEYYVPNYRSKITKYCSRSCLAKIELPKYIKIYGFKKTGKPYHKYKYIKDENGNRVREHRYIMEKHLNRKLSKDEHVHHINDNSLDNRIENLIVLSNSEHQKIELARRKEIIISS